MNTTNELKPIPKIGSSYHFFDDGKIRESRHYIATVLDVITPEQTKNIGNDIDVDPKENRKMAVGADWERSCHSQQVVYKFFSTLIRNPKQNIRDS